MLLGRTSRGGPPVLRRLMSAAVAADPGATLRRANRFKWQRTATVFDGLTVGCVGWGSPALASPPRREAALRGAITGGCGWVELNEPLTSDDPRLETPEAHGDQFT